MTTQSNPSDSQQGRKVQCHSCGLPQPIERAHSIKGRYYCTDCLVAGAELAGLASESDLSNYSAGRAALFGLLPGLGAVYNNQYVKAVQHFAIFAGLVMLADYSVIFIFASIVFYLYTIVDAYRSAQDIIRRKIRRAQTGQPVGNGARENVPIWGIALIGLGALFFLDNLRLVSIRDLFDYLWPLVFVAIGVYLIFDFYRRGENGEQQTQASHGGRPAGNAYGGSAAAAPPQPPQASAPPEPEVPSAAPESEPPQPPAPTRQTASESSSPQADQEDHEAEGKES
ncbi:MAG TPA: DUF5668 domain-containing protein [Acidobacteriota bacterium]|nr:DUF5668 domain-containing protein [Acidobacteriota bacterium]